MIKLMIIWINSWCPVYIQSSWKIALTCVNFNVFFYLSNDMLLAFCFIFVSIYTYLIWIQPAFLQLKTGFGTTKKAMLGIINTDGHKPRQWQLILVHGSWGPTTSAMEWTTVPVCQLLQEIHNQFIQKKPLALQTHPMVPAVKTTWALSGKAHYEDFRWFYPVLTAGAVSKHVG